MPHLILPTDFSEASLNAVRFASAFYGGAGSRATLVHMYQHPTQDNALLPGFDAMARRQASRELGTFQRKCREFLGSMKITRLLSSAWLTKVLNDLTEKHKADLIIMGTHGAGAGTLVGNMANEVVMEAIAPVVLVPGQWSRAPIKRILFAHDGGPLDRHTVQPLLKLARRKKAEVVFAHVRNNAIALDKRMDRKTIAALFKGIAHTFVTVQGDSVAPTIDELARDGKIQLVVAVHRKRGFWQSLLHRSKAKRMALHNQVPLLVLRQSVVGNPRTLQQDAQWLYNQVQPSQDV